MAGLLSITHSCPACNCIVAHRFVEPRLIITHTFRERNNIQQKLFQNTFIRFCGGCALVAGAKHAAGTDDREHHQQHSRQATRKTQPQPLKRGDDSASQQCGVKQAGQEGKHSGHCQTGT